MLDAVSPGAVATKGTLTTAQMGLWGWGGLGAAPARRGTQGLGGSRLGETEVWVGQRAAGWGQPPDTHPPGRLSQ